MKYNLAFKYRIYPNKEQELLINKTFGCVRFVYNTILYTANKIYEETGKNKIITPASLKSENQCGIEYKRCWKRNVEILGNKKTGQGLSEELGKYIWLAKAGTSQEAPASKSGSSSLKIKGDGDEREKI